MVIKVFISGISGSKEVKKRQQESLLILDTIKIDYKVIDITEPGHEEERDMMKEICKKRNSDPLPLSPQFFNNDDYCGDWEDFFAASDDDKIHSFLKLEEPAKCELTPLPSSDEIIQMQSASQKDDLDISDVSFSDKNAPAFEDESGEANTDDEQISAHETGDLPGKQDIEEVEEEAITLSPTLDMTDELKKDENEAFEEDSVEE